MTVSEEIIKWLKKFEKDTRKLKRIDTDIQSDDSYTYSLVREPIQNVKTYLSGKKEYTDHYMIQARLPFQYNTDRVGNNTFGESLEEWVRTQNHEGNYPELDSARVCEISITTPFYVGRAQEDSSIYQMTIAIKYVKER